MNSLKNVAMRTLMSLALAAALAASGLARADFGANGDPIPAKARAVQFSLIGFWQRTTKNQDNATTFLSFQKGGRVQMGTLTDSGSAKDVGDYAYRIEDGELSLSRNGGDLTVMLDWIDANHFRLTTEGRAPTVWARSDDPTAAKPAPKKQRPAADAVELIDTGWLRVDASEDGSHKTLYFGPGDVLVVADVNAEGQILNKQMGRYTRDGNTVILRDSDGTAIVTCTMTPDGKGYIHLTRGDGAETVWMPLSK